MCGGRRRVRALVLMKMRMMMMMGSCDAMEGGCGGGGMLRGLGSRVRFLLLRFGSVPLCGGQSEAERRPEAPGWSADAGGGMQTGPAIVAGRVQNLGGSDGVG